MDQSGWLLLAVAKFELHDFRMVLLPQMFHFFAACILMGGQLCEVGNWFL